LCWRRKKNEAAVRPGFRTFAGVFEGYFGKYALIVVVFCWCKRGEMRGKRGQKTVSRTPLKNTPSISNIFCRFPIWHSPSRGMAWLSSRHRPFYGPVQVRRLPSNACWAVFRGESARGGREIGTQEKGGDKNLHLCGARSEV